MIRQVPHNWQIPLALGAVYLIWGSTYLGMKIATDTMPPYLMAGSRFCTAGIILYLIGHWRSGKKPGWQHWRSAIIVGGALLLGGNATVAWSVGRLPTGIASLMIATMPMWMVLLDWRWHGGLRPSMPTVAGLLLGFVGIGLLMNQEGGGLAGQRIDLVAMVALLGAAIVWAAGSLYSRKTPQLGAPILYIGMQNICGGVMVLIAGLLGGEWDTLHIAQISSASVYAWGYLILFGSMIGFSCYIWLLGVAPAARVSTYAYVNPVVAVFLGWMFNSESLTLQTVVASILIVAAVAVIIRQPQSRFPKPRRQQDTDYVATAKPAEESLG